jgi:GT2 family glycosyltransferase
MNTENVKQPLVSIITVNYNQSKVTADFLKSLRKISYTNIEVFVVDNASPNDTPESLKKAFPEIQLIQSKKNLGFAGGNNLAVKLAKGKHLLFINNDTEVPEHFLEPLVEALEKDDTIGMVSPKIKFFWEDDLVQYAGFTKMNPYTIRNKSIGYYQKDGPEFDKRSKTHAAHGAAMMVPRKAIEDVGMMAEVYFLYYEEHDWAERIKRAGFSILYEPNSYVLHKESVSTGKDSPFKTYYLARNRLLFARRNYKGLEKFISICFQLFISWPKNTLMYLLKGEFKHLSSYWRGIIWNFTHLKDIKSNPKI